MNYRGRMTAITINFTAAIILSIYQFINGIFTIHIIGLAIVFILPAWWIGKQVDKVYFSTQELEQSKEELKRKIELLEQTKKELEEKYMLLERNENYLKDKNKLLEERKEKLQQIFDSDEVNVFSHNLSTNKLYISKGIECIYGYSREDLIDTLNLLKDFIYVDDVQKATDKEKRLLLGKPIKSEHRIINGNGEIRWIAMGAAPVIDSSGSVVKINGSVTDITECKHLQEKLKQMAYYDDLTDLPNRKTLERHLKKTLARSKRHNHHLGIMFIDLDGFKKVNDTLGHDAGDSLLKEVAYRLTDNVREEDLIARLGGDEFIIVIEETNKQEIERIAERLLEAVSNPYAINEEEANVSPSIGISMFPDDGEDHETLIQNADKAMYYAKNNGKGTYTFYTPELSDFQSKKFDVFGKIRETVSRIRG
jgi:diguanylate cyclase